VQVANTVAPVRLKIACQFVSKIATLSFAARYSWPKSEKVSGRVQPANSASWALAARVLLDKRGFHRRVWRIHIGLQAQLARSLS
jgi:hypothetical protein